MKGRKRKCWLLEKDRMCGIWQEIFWILVCMWFASNTISPLKTWHNPGTQRNISKEGRKRPFVIMAKLLQSLKKPTCLGHQVVIGASKFTFSCFPRIPDTVRQRSTTFLHFFCHLTLLDAISLTECLVCSVSSWSRHQSSSSSVSTASFW